MDWLKVILAVAPKAKPSIAQGLADAMPKIVETYRVSTDLRQAHFLAQVAHESDGFRTTVEYASGKAYEGRKDLGNTAKGDGVKFKGFGLVQTTGRANQREVAKALGIEVKWTDNPRVLAEFPYAALSAGHYFQTRRCNELADSDDGKSDAACKAITKKVNGGLNGYAERKTYLARAKKALKVEHEVEEGPEPLPRADVAAAQESLKGAGYPVGTVDGQVGTKTIGAVASFQANNDLPVTSTLDPATLDALKGKVEPASVSAARAEGEPGGSRILTGARKLQAAAATAAAGGVAKLAADPLSAIEGAGTYYARLKAALVPFEGLGAWIAAHWAFFLIAAAVAVFVTALGIERARIEDHQTGKTA